jgi:hypothetical protein
MNTTKHTPGPWSASKDGYIDAPDGALVAKVHTEGDAATHDANLIAAALDLLAALRDMLSAADAIGATQGEATPAEDALFEARRSARAAITKATGQP